MSMFSWLFRNRDGTYEDYMQMLQMNIAKMRASQFAIQKCIGIIGNAIAKSEIIVQRGNGPVVDENYYRLNVKPNENETGTEFWGKVTEKLLTEGRCLVVPLKGMYFVAESWNESNEVIKSREYTNVLISSGGQTMTINKRIHGSDAIMIRLPMTANRRVFLDNLMKLYNQTVDVAAAAYKLAYTPKWAIKVNTAVRLSEKSADGNTRTLTGTEYANRIKTLLKSEDIENVVLPEGVTLEQLQMQQTNGVTAKTLDEAVRSAEEACCRAFDIPTTVYFGTITEKSDATNELITYAVSPVAEAVNDALNSYMVGMDDYIQNSERIMVFLARFKHIDIIDSADKLSKMRGDGWTMDEIFHLIGYPEMHTDFTTTRALTKNYSTGEPEGAADGSVSGNGASNRKLSVINGRKKGEEPNE